MSAYTDEQTQEIVRAAGEFVKVWEELAQALPEDYHCFMTCDEAEALAALFDACGEEWVAEAIIANHSTGDEPGESHYTGDESE